MQIEINPNIFNKTYWILRDALNNSKYRFILIYGGSSSSKTYSIIQNILFECSLIEQSNTMVLRKYSTDIRDSVLNDFKGQISQYGLNDVFSPQINLIKCKNGSEVRFRGLDNSEKIKGLANYKRVYLNEVTQFEESDLKQIRKRLRGKHGQQIICDWNPIDQLHWLKKNFIDLEEWHELEHDLNESHSFVKENKEGDILLIKTTFRDNYWICGDHPEEGFGFYDEHTIADFRRDELNDFDFFNIYANGNWGKLVTGGEFYKSFREKYNVKHVEYNKEEPLHISVDENVQPYMAMLISQYVEGEIRVIDEIALQSPKNNLNFTCTEFLKRYGNHESGVFIYGDATSRKEDVKLQKGQNFFILLKQRLEELRPVIRVPLSNPPVIPRGLFMNGLFAGEIENCKVYINPKCVNTIEDLKFVIESDEGKKLKKRVKNKETGATYEERGHFSDCLDYLTLKILTKEFRAYTRNKKNTKKLEARNERQVNWKG